MAKQLDALLIIDLEATCWEKEPPPGQSNEIIEIGLCLLETKHWEVLERTSWLVLPSRSEISPFCTQLTTISPEMVAEAGLPLAEVVRLLNREYQSKTRPWASWGDYDRRQFERNCQQQKLPYPFGPTHLNLKTWFALHQRLERELGVEGALRHLGLAFEGTAHRGGDDAYNIARIAQRTFL
ncbi:MAG: 3'-5' exonuclease [Microscillaceae bacterium]